MSYSDYSPHFLSSSLSAPPPSGGGGGVRLRGRAAGRAVYPDGRRHELRQADGGRMVAGETQREDRTLPRQLRQGRRTLFLLREHFKDIREKT